VPPTGTGAGRPDGALPTPGDVVAPAGADDRATAPAAHAAGRAAGDVVARVEHLGRTFGKGGAAAVALADVSLELRRGEVVALTGPSGSGKSTLLHILGAMDEPSSGRVVVAGRDLAGMNDAQASAFRNRHLGFVFQSFHLVPSLSVLENIALPGRLAARDAHEVAAEASALAARVGLGELLARKPDQLSGGQRQRVAIARALVNRPALVLADEPTGNLDHASGAGVMALLCELSRERGAAVLLATHDPLVTAAADREIRLADGRVVDGGIDSAMDAAASADAARADDTSQTADASRAAGFRGPRSTSPPARSGPDGAPRDAGR
jgi:ABC-type lipoprotein export system ATPase subunit